MASAEAVKESVESTGNPFVDTVKRIAERGDLNIQQSVTEVYFLISNQRSDAIRGLVGRLTTEFGNSDTAKRVGKVLDKVLEDENNRDVPNVEELEGGDTQETEFETHTVIPRASQVDDSKFK
jgi:hypothetical protein